MDVSISNYVRDWMREYINPEGYAVEGEIHPAAPEAARRLVADAVTQGIKHKELEQTVGNLEQCLTKAFDVAADREVNRLLRNTP